MGELNLFIMTSTDVLSDGTNVPPKFAREKRSLPGKFAGFLDLV